MIKKFTFVIIFGVWLSMSFSTKAYCQLNTNHLQELQFRLDSLSESIPGLNQKVQLSISGIPLQEYLRALSRSTGISFQVDPAVKVVVNNTLNNVTASNILLLLSAQYNLDVTAIGKILLVKPYVDPMSFARTPVRQPKISFRQLDNSLSFELTNDSLVAVGRRITQLSGRNILIPPALQGKLVSIFAEGAPFDIALEKLAFANEIKLVRTNDNFYVFEPLGEGEQVYVNGDRKTAVRRTYKPAANIPAGSLGLSARMVNGKKLLSVNAANANIADLVRSASQEISMNYFVYSDLKGAVNVISATDLSYESFLGLIFKGTDYTFNQENGVYMIGERRLEGLRANKAVVLQHRSLDTVLAMIPQEWKKGVEIREFREQNTILLSGSKPQIEEIASFINQIDLLVPQILIEVTLIDVKKSRRVATGLSFGTADSVKTGGTVLPGVDYTISANSVNDLLTKVGGVFSVNLGHVIPSFYLNIRALENNDNVEVRSVPKLSALNGHTASLSIGNSFYYKNVTQSLYPSASTNTSIFSNIYQESNANLSIKIKPIVSGDDQVTLGINIDISDFTSLPTDGSPPPKSTSKFESTLRVHNEDMVVLGGIERTESSDNSSGVPILSRIPILKWIFSSKNKVRSKVVTLVFIKPTIIR